MKKGYYIFITSMILGIACLGKILDENKDTHTAAKPPKNTYIHYQAASDTPLPTDQIPQ